MNPFVFDIETGPRPDAEAWLPPIEPPSNYKDPAKIAAYVAERKSSALERAALGADTGRVLCVGVLRNSDVFRYVHHDDERELLNATWLALECRGAADVFVTFNGNKFDFPFLLRRSYILGVTVPSWMPRDGRWKPRQHVDLMEWWQAGDRQETISLDRLARLCGLPGKTDTGAAFAAMWAANRDNALTYLKHDLELTRDLYLRLAAGHEASEPASETPVVPRTAPELLEDIKSLLTQRWPGATEADKAGRQGSILAACGCGWSDLKQMPADALRVHLAALQARLEPVSPTPLAHEPDENPMTFPTAAPVEVRQTSAPSVPPKSEPRMEVVEKATAAPADAEPGVAEALAMELRRVLGTADNIRLAVAWMQRNKWLTAAQACTTDPLLHVPQEKAEKALGSPERFLTAIGAKGGVK